MGVGREGYKWLKPVSGVLHQIFSAYSLHPLVPLFALSHKPIFRLLTSPTCTPSALSHKPSILNFTFLFLFSPFLTILTAFLHILSQGSFLCNLQPLLFVSKNRFFATSRTSSGHHIQVCCASSTFFLSLKFS